MVFTAPQLQDTVPNMSVAAFVRVKLGDAKWHKVKAYK